MALFPQGPGWMDEWRDERRNRRVAFEYVLLTDWRWPAWQAETGGDETGRKECRGVGGGIMMNGQSLGQGFWQGGCVLLTAKLPAAGVTQQQSQPGMTPPFLLLSQRPLGFVVGRRTPSRSPQECSRLFPTGRTPHSSPSSTYVDGNQPT